MSSRIKNDLNNPQLFNKIVAYELLYQKYKSVKKLADLFKQYPTKDFISIATKLGLSSTSITTYLEKIFKEENFNFVTNNSEDYPRRLQDAKNPIELLYYQGNLKLLQNRAIAIIGSRKASLNGLRRTKKLVCKLVEDNFTIISGLARGIDTEAHQTALKNKGSTIAVIGTPLNKYYPSENKYLQKEIAKSQLVLSQVPFYYYATNSYLHNRFFFPERNKTMSALSEATVIVEATQTSGTLIQAKSALYQGRKLFILDNNFRHVENSWAYKLQEKGAIRVREYSDIITILGTNKNLKIINT